MAHIRAQQKRRVLEGTEHAPRERGASLPFKKFGGPEASKPEFCLKRTRGWCHRRQADGFIRDALAGEPRQL